MKNLILISILFVAFQCKAQTTKPIDGFLGIKFGSTPEQVIEALKAKDAVLDKATSKETMLSFDNISLGNRKTKEFYVKFVDNKAYEVDFLFKDDLEAKTIEYYNSLVKDINDVYGAGNGSKNFKQPYTDGDGYELTAIKSGNADYRTIWNDTNSKNAIWIKILNDTYIELIYQDDALAKIEIDKQKAKNKSEF